MRRSVSRRFLNRSVWVHSRARVRVPSSVHALRACLRPPKSESICSRYFSFCFIFISSLASIIVRQQRSNEAQDVAKGFGRQKTKIGYGKQHVFYSIRKTAANDFEQAGVPERITADITWHEKQTKTDALYLEVRPLRCGKRRLWSLRNSF